MLSLQPDGSYKEYLVWYYIDLDSFLQIEDTNTVPEGLQMRMIDLELLENQANNNTASRNSNPGLSDVLNSLDDGCYELQLDCACGGLVFEKVKCKGGDGGGVGGPGTSSTDGGQPGSGGYYGGVGDSSYSDSTSSGSTTTATATTAAPPPIWAQITNCLIAAGSDQFTREIANWLQEQGTNDNSANDSTNIDEDDTSSGGLTPGHNLTPLHNYLQENECSPEALDIGLEVLAILMSAESLTFEEALLQTGNIIINPNEATKVDPAEELSCFDLTQEAKLTVYVQQPRENSDDVVGPNEVGHAFIGIEQNGIVRQVGYYPDKEVGLTGVGDDYDATIKLIIIIYIMLVFHQNVSSTQLTNIVNYTIDFPPIYNTNNYACADYAIAIGNLGGMALPSTTVNSYIFSGRSPGKLGQKIRAMNSTNTTTITNTAANSPLRQGECSN